MGALLTTGSTLSCSFGSKTSKFRATSAPAVVAGGKPVGSLSDFKPLVNIPSFGMCRSIANPQVATATTAAMGVLTPQPCVPVTTPWKSATPTVVIGGKPALTHQCTCNCAYAGEITVVNPAQKMVVVN